MREPSTLVRQEVQLAKAELTQSATEAARHQDPGGGGAAVYAGLLFLLAELDAWLSALIVGLVVALGAVLVQRVQESLKSAHLAPRRTVEPLKEDQEWAKEQIT